MKVAIRDTAYGDLLAIKTWIARDRPGSAASVLDRILISIERLGRFPEVGHRGRVTGTMEWAVPGLPYVVVYRVYDDIDLVSVIGVFHGAQNRDRITRS